MKTRQPSSLPAPVAPRRPHSFTRHGITVVDDYARLKDPNWQEVLRDPSVLGADIRNYLEAENDYTESLLGHTTSLQKTLVAEMRGRIKEDDSSVPAPDGPFAYFRRFRDGGQHELFGRSPRDGGETEIILDGDQLAADQEYFRFGGAQHSPDHRLEAWSADIKGSEYFSIRVREWATGKDRDDLIEETDGSVVWNADSNAFFYVIAGGDHETSEHRLIDLADPDAPPRLVAAREEGVQYSVADRGDELFILTNADKAIDFKIVTATLASPGRANWHDLIPHRLGVYILEHDLYAGHLVRLERANALPAIIIRDLTSGEEHAIAF